MLSNFRRGLTSEFALSLKSSIFCQNQWGDKRKRGYDNDDYFIKESSEDEYTKLINFMDLYSQKDLSDDKNYQEVCNVLDVDSFLDHYAINLYLATFDWPNLNFGLWRNNGNKIDSNEYSDGKWRFMTYDLDYTEEKHMLILVELKDINIICLGIWIVVKIKNLHVYLLLF